MGLGQQRGRGEGGGAGQQHQRAGLGNRAETSGDADQVAVLAVGRGVAHRRAALHCQPCVLPGQPAEFIPRDRAAHQAQAVEIAHRGGGHLGQGRDAVHGRGHALRLRQEGFGQVRRRGRTRALRVAGQVIGHGAAFSRAGPGRPALGGTDAGKDAVAGVVGFHGAWLEWQCARARCGDYRVDTAAQLC
ncbi:hypothetical protein CBM2600_A120637 [Cupriavidus taiwanensis]|nr:hypothetical protein CBM2600_A120637 [Cupriavidus taiwanensis]